MTVWPSGGRSVPPVTSEYGARTDPISGAAGYHTGIDIIGFPINKSPAAGVVIFAQYNGGAGNEVRVRADNGDVFRIKHNARLLVSEGQRVAEGQDVGVMGTTGYSTGIHCHFECWPGGRTHVNPRAYMGSAAPAGSTGTPYTESDTMDRLIRTPDGSIGLAAGDGDFLPLHNMNEVESLRATSLPNPDIIQLPDNNIWNVRVDLAARKQLAKSSDPAAIAKTVAGLLVPAVVTALAGKVGVTKADVQAAAETAMREVFSDASKS